MPPLVIAIRRADLVDAELIASLGARTFWQAFAADNDPADMESYVSSRFASAQIELELQSPASVFFIAQVSGEPLGYAKLREAETPDCVAGPDPVELERIYADRSVLGMGVGSALMNACLEAAWARGRRTIWLGVWEKNHRAVEFYRRWGFQPVGTHTFVLGEDVQQDLVMARPLKSGRKQLKKRM